MNLTIEQKDVRVILASGSPRRLELLRQVGIEPEVEPSHVEEVITSTIPDQVVIGFSQLCGRLFLHAVRFPFFCRTQHSQ